MQAPVMVLNTNTKRESGKLTQLANIQAAKVLKYQWELYNSSFHF
jgi:T-complex protein 1 subunit gamma